jgi:hypothetical protein
LPAPALAVVTSAYYVTDLYGRGAWPEFMATSAMAPLLAVHIAGLERVGRSPYGGVVVKRPHGGSRPVHVAIEQRTTLQSSWPD